MEDKDTACPKCGSSDIRFREKRKEWICEDCDHRWEVDAVAFGNQTELSSKPRLFLSYGRRDGKELAEQLCRDLAEVGYEVWQDTKQIRGGHDWQQEIADGLRSTQLVLAILSPHAVRTAADPENPDNLDSVCLDELSFARFSNPPTPIVPVMAELCEPPFVVFRLNYIDMTQWQTSDEHYQVGLRQLLDDLEAALAGKPRHRTWETDRELKLTPWDFSALLNEKRRDFTGRDWLFDEIDLWRSAGGNERALLITGDPGTGKSAIVAQLAHLNPRGQVLAYHCCQADTPATLQPWIFVRNIAAMIASKLPDYAAQLESDEMIRRLLTEVQCRTDPISAFEQGVLAPLEQLHQSDDGPRYILIDALDEALLSPDSITLVDLLAARLERLPGWLRIVATTRKEPLVLNRLRGLRATELDSQDPRNLGDINIYITARLKTPNLAKRLTASGISDERVITTLQEKSDGKFLYVRQALDGLERDQYHINELDALPPGLFGLYENFFRRHFPDEARFASARAVLQVIIAAQEPLSAKQIAVATGLDEEDELPLVLRRLSVYLPCRAGENGDVRYSLFHKSLIDWLTSDELKGTTYFASHVKGHHRLAQLGWYDYQQHCSAKRMSPYDVAHLPHHLTATKRWDDLETLLTDLFYLEAKNEAGMIFSLTVDFTTAVESLPKDRPQYRILSLLDEAIRRDVQFIARHAEDYPQALFQCVWNHGWWFDSDKAAKHFVELETGRDNTKAPWLAPVEEKLCCLLQRCRRSKEEMLSDSTWLESHRPPPIHLGSSQKVFLRGHEDSVTSVSYSPDGRRIASGARDNTIRLWDADTGAELTVLRGHEDLVTSVSYSPDGRSVSSGARDKTVRVWDAETGAELAVLRGHEDYVNSVSYSPDGQRIASGSDDDTVRVWDVETSAELVVLRGHKDWVHSISYSPDGWRIASGSIDKTVRVWDAETGAELAVLRGHEDYVTSVSYSPDGRRIASGSDDNTVRIWDTETNTALAVLRGHEDGVCSISYRLGERQIASSSRDKTVRVWDVETGTEVAILRGHGEYVTSVSYSPNGRRFASGSDDNTVQVWDADRDANLTVLRGHEDWICSLSYSPDGRCIASGSSDNTVRVWDAETGVELSVLREHEDWVYSVSYSPDGQRFASSSRDKTVRVWDAKTDAELAVLRGHEDYVTSVSYSPDGRRIASGSDDNTVRVWDAETGAELAVLRGHEDWVCSVSYSPDGRRIASGSGDKTVRVWEAETGAELAVWRGHEDWVLNVSYSPNGRQIVSGSRDKTVRVWDAETGESMEVIQGSGDVAAIAAESSSGLPWRAIARGQETIIEPTSGGAPVARFPISIRHITTHPSGRSWAGSVGNHLYILFLEGGDQET